MLNFDEFDVLSFDCYGTMIDWESGIAAALEPTLAAHSVTITRERLLELFGALESDAERAPFREYKAVLQAVLEGIGERLGFTPGEEELQRFARSAGDWPPFADSSAALDALHMHYKLAVISNVDDDLFARSERRLGVKFDWIITAQQVRSYKPSTRTFEMAFERIGVPRDRILHVAQSLFHDIAPARALGLSTVWVNRRRGRSGAGATPPAEARPDLEVPDLRSLAEIVRGNRARPAG